MVRLKPKPKLQVFLSIAVTHQMRDDMNAKAKQLDMSVSEIARQLLEKFLAGEFDNVEEIRSRSRSKNGRKVQL